MSRYLGVTFVGFKPLGLDDKDSGLVIFLAAWPVMLGHTN